MPNRNGTWHREDSPPACALSLLQRCWEIVSLLGRSLLRCDLTVNRADFGFCARGSLTLSEERASTIPGSSTRSPMPAEIRSVSGTMKGSAKSLDAAQALGLTVCAGFWVGQVRQGFDWGNAAALARERERLRTTVIKYKDHPALLLWAIGNEMEDPEGKNRAVWIAINDLAAMVKQIDPHHPTMTVIAEIGGEKVKNIHRLCPAIDIIGINSYGGAPSLGARYTSLGATKPYILTEFGPPGIWEMPKDPLGAFPEPTSTEKADIYRRAYQGAVLEQPGLCLGSYVFYWGQKQEVTSTWFSMFLRDGSRLGAVDAMSELWTGKPPANRSPVIATLAISGKPSGKAGALIEAKLAASDPENDPLRAEWRLQRDPEEFGTGGDREEEPPFFNEAIIRGDLQGAQVRLPAEAGLYRLFVAVRDNHGGAATANVPVRVDGPAVGLERLPCRASAHRVFGSSRAVGLRSVRLDGGYQRNSIRPGMDRPATIG